MSSFEVRPVHKRYLVLIMLAGFALLGSVFVTAPEAEAQPNFIPGVSYVVDAVLPAGTPCPADTFNVGTIGPGFNPFAFPITGEHCRPFGFHPVLDEVQCTNVGAVWFALPTGRCGVSGRVGVPPGGCPAPLLHVIGIAGGLPFDGCARQALSDQISISSGTPVCIESDLVQTTEAAADLAIGNMFEGPGGERYLIQGGPSTCKLNCYDGFDFNCDNKLGDFCSVGDATTVRGVKACLGLDEPALAAAAAPAAAGVPPVAVPISGSPGLAATGAESTPIFNIGASLLGLGAIALGTRRRLLNR